MRTKNCYLWILPVALLLLGNFLFTSCSKDDDDKDNKSSNLDGYWKLTKSTDSSPGEELFGDNEGFIWQFDEATKKITSCEYDYEDQLIYAGSLNYAKDGKTISYVLTNPETGKKMTVTNEIKKLNSKELVLFSDYSKETLYFKRVSKPEFEQVNINKNQLACKWQLVETWEPGASNPEAVDPSEVRISWTFKNSGDVVQETTYMSGPAMANMYKWNLYETSIMLYNYMEPEQFEKSYDIVRYGGTNPIMKIREWTSEYTYRILKFKSMAAG